MAAEIIPIAFAFSVVALMVYIAVFNPKQLVHIKELWTGSAVNRPRASHSKEDGRNKDRKWGSKIRNGINIADLPCSLVSRKTSNNPGHNLIQTGHSKRRNPYHIARSDTAPSITLQWAFGRCSGRVGLN